MVTGFLRCLWSEGLKLRRSLASWTILAGGLFTPVIILVARLRRPSALPTLYQSGVFWEKHWTQSWESITILILPIMAILLTALIAQLEYRNNTWKQVHTSPQPLALIFLAKLTVALAMMVLLLIVINLGVYLSGALPAWIVPGVSLSANRIPYRIFADRNFRYFIDCLPVVGLQYLLSLQFRNFMVPLGVGMALWIGALGFLNSAYNYVVPYALGGVDYLIDIGQLPADRYPPVNTQTIALGCFMTFALVSYILYITKKDRG